MSRYTNYQGLIDDMSAEAGIKDGAHDDVILNLLQSVVDQLNLRRLECRQARGTITLAVSDYDYTIADHLSDFMEPIDDKTSFRLSNGSYVEVIRKRSDFLDGWTPASESGTPLKVQIFGGVFYVRPTPAVADTMAVDYYKRLAAPAVGGAVTIPDEYVGILRARVGKRLEAYNESESFEMRRAVLSEIETDVIRAINRDEAYRSPSSVVCTTEV